MFPSCTLFVSFLFVISYIIVGNIPENSFFNCIVVAINTWEIISKGILKIEDIEDDFPYAFQHLPTKSKSKYINKAIKYSFGAQRVSLCFLLILRLFSAFLFLDGTRPYQQVRFSIPYILEEDGNFHTKNF